MSARKNKFLFFSVFSLLFCVLCGFLFAEEFLYDAHGKKDPFSPPIISTGEKTGAEVLTGVKLEGIIWDEKKPIAIINDKVVGIGDTISGAKIIEIKKDEVIFDINGQTVSVKIKMEK